MAKFAPGVVDTSGACILASEYLREFSEKFKMTIMLFSGAWRKMFHEKKPEAKNLVTLSLLLRLKLGGTKTTTSSSFFGQLKKAIQWQEESTV